MRIGRYEVVRKLATGGMAEVFLAKAAGPLGFEKDLVVKRILPHLLDNPSFVEMFLSEVRLAAQLNHPHIVQLFDFGEAEGAYFLAMEYCDGPNLRMLVDRARRRETPLSLALCAKIVAWACEGLAYAHELQDPATQRPLNLIHRDISPDNILLSRQGAVKVADFGIAKAGGARAQTQQGILKGKLAYMAPEYLKHQPIDRRADLYALGLVLYELVTGHKPFDATAEVDVLQAILFEPFIPAAERRRGVPEFLQRILDRALAKERDERYPDGLAFQSDLERFILSEGEPVGALQVARLISNLEPPGRAGAARRIPATPVPLKTSVSEGTPTLSLRPGAHSVAPVTQLRKAAGPTMVAGEPSQFDKLLRASGSLSGKYSDIIGREEELALLLQRFQEGARLVTILGPGGMGKTHLAIHFGSTLLHVRQCWAGGVWLCVLTEASSVGDICHAVGKALDVDLTHGGKDWDAAEQVGRALASRGPMLLILDNMEHLMSHASATLGRWRTLAPDTRFLVTSREAMRLPGEWVLDLAPLGLPAEDETSREAISRSDAVRLFVQRAQAVQGDFVLTAEKAPRVAEIVRRLDGIALAIELAAARTPVLGVSQIRERLSRRFELLRAGRRDASARQATLRGTIDWSWNLLEPAEREALAQCSVFRGGFTLEAAEAVLELPPESPEVLDVIQSLRTKSLLRTAPTGDVTGERRLTLYESVREYASERLAELGAHAEAVARHADFFLGQALGLTGLLHGSSGIEALRRLSADRENLLAVCDNALSEQPVTPGSLARALSGLIALEPDVTERGPMDLTLDRLDKALELAARTPVDEKLRAEALAVRGRSNLEMGRLPAARKDLEEARRSFHELGAAAQEKRVLLELSTVARHEGNMNAGWQLMQEAHALPSGGDRWLEGYAVGNLGLFEMTRSGAAAALPHLRTALELFRGLGDSTFELMFLINYALAIGEQGQMKEAVALFEEALSKSTQVGDRFRHALARLNIGCLLLEDNRAADAIEHLEAAVPIGRQYGSRLMEACARGELGRAYLTLGAPEKAQVHLREATVGLSEASRWHMLRFSAHLAAVHAALGQLPVAQESFLSLEAAPELREDPVLSELVSLLRAAVEVTQARTETLPAQAEQCLSAARQRLERARRAPPAAASSDLRSSLRLLEQWMPPAH